MSTCHLADRLHGGHLLLAWPCAPPAPQAVVLVLMVVVSVRRVVLFLPCEAASFPPSHSLLCHRLQTPGDILKTLGLRCRDTVSHPVLKALVDLLNFLHLVRNQDQVVSPEKLCTVFLTSFQLKHEKI